MADLERTITATTKGSKMESFSENTRPPQLPLSIQKSKKAIIIAWTIIVFVNFILPSVLWFVLEYGTNVSEIIVYTVPTVVFGVFSIFNLIKRLTRLLSKDDKYRPLYSSRWEIDYFMVNFIIGFITITLFISVGIAKHKYRLIAIAYPYLLLATAPQLLITSVLERWTNIRYFCKISSMTGEKKLRSGVYTIVEDICAVDAGYGKEYRVAIDRRYESSLEFRNLITKCGFLCGGVCTIVGIGCVIAIALVDSRVGQWVIGWVVPPIASAILAIITISWVKSSLRKESQNWQYTQFQAV